MIGSLFNNPLEFVFSVIGLLVAITVHEFSHAYAADRLGDPTPRVMGRLTLNPLAHLDPIGTIMLLLVRFGWGKPVVFDPYNLKNPRRDGGVISIAGPISNFLTAIVCAGLVRLLFALRLTLLSNPISGLTVYLLLGLLQYVTLFNVMLGVFNLIPINPLDGFKIVEGILPDTYARQWKELEGYGFIFLLFLILPIFGGIAPINRVISPAIDFILGILLPGFGGV
jgi:Zn-dependent protease